MVAHNLLSSGIAQTKLVSERGRVIERERGKQRERERKRERESDSERNREKG